MDGLPEATADVDDLFLINGHAAVSRGEEANQRLAEAAANWSHTTLLDWSWVAARIPR